ncbi:MAG TPA: CBS domain-containing protein [Candidatus Dormibacteraeota bacterium]|nr:CBS domain-containing protein [Candidatus Dormibacteraeota bacterium]
MTTRVHEVMTTKVVTVTPDTDFKSIARLLQRHHVNLLPVIDKEHHVVGVVSEADLLSKVEWQGRHPGRIERWLLLDDVLRKAEGTLASEIMTRDMETSRPDTTVSEVARRMMFSHVRSVPVVDENNRLVGIVSRADLLKSFVRDDAAIHSEVVDGVLRGALAIEPEAVTVVVKDGQVFLKGEVESRSLSEMVSSMVSAVPGVVSVFNAIDCRLDDRHLKTTAEPADALTYTGPPLR